MHIKETHTRRRFIQTTSVVGAIALACCGGNSGGGGDGNESDGGGGDADTRLTWHAGGTYFPLSNEFKTVVEENTEFTLNVQSPGASVENVGNLASGDADLAHRVPRSFL